MSEDMKQELDDIKTVLTKIQHGFESIDKRFDGIDKRLDRHVVTKSEFRIGMSHLEAFAAQQASFRRQWLIQGDMLMAHHNCFGNHESRIIQLESRPKTA